MANPNKGEVAFSSDGKNYTFVLGTYGLAALQRRTGMPMQKFFARKPNDWGVDDLLAVFYAGMLRHHNLSEEQTADLIDEIGQAKAGEIVREAIELAFPPVKAEAVKTSARPTTRVA